MWNGALEHGQAAANSGGVRGKMIANSAAAYDAEKRTHTVICERAAWVDDTLRVTGLVRLTASEKSALNAAEPPIVKRAVAQRAAVAPRGDVITVANSQFDVERTLRRVLCSRVAWVNQSRREAGYSKMDSGELLTVGTD